MLSCGEMSEVLQFDMPFVKDLPKREQSRVQRMWDQLCEFKRLTEENGVLIPAPVAAKIAGVHRSRIFQLIDAGALKSVSFHGHVYLIEDSFIAWAKSERKAGRPFKLVDDAEKKGDIRAALEIGVSYAKEFAAARKASRSSKK